MKTFVSMKYLALIHLIAGEVPPGLHVAQPSHKGIEGGAATGSCCILLKPFAKRRIQGLALGLRYKAGSFDQSFVSAKSNVFHTDIVYTIYVYTATVALCL
jgi:hypothetical protein